MNYRHLLSLVLGAMLVGCGGGGDSGGTGGSNPPPPTNAAVGGIWEGTTTISGQGTIELIGLVSEDGRAHFIQFDGVQYWGTVLASGNNISMSFTGATPIGTTFLDGSTSGTGSLTGTIQQRGSISASATFTTAGGTRTTSSISLTYNNLYDRDSSLATVAGNYTFAGNPGVDSVTVSSSGVLFGQVPSTGCVLNGQVDVINPAYNAYNIQYTYSSCTGPDAVLNGSTFRGIATLDNTGSPEVAIAGLQGSVAGSLFSVVFVYQRT